MQTETQAVRPRGKQQRRGHSKKTYTRVNANYATQYVPLNTRERVEAGIATAAEVAEVQLQNLTFAEIEEAKIAARTARIERAAARQAEANAAARDERIKHAKAMRKTLKRATRSNPKTAKAFLHKSVYVYFDPVSDWWGDAVIPLAAATHMRWCEAYVYRAENRRDHIELFLIIRDADFEGALMRADAATTILIK